MSSKSPWTRLKLALNRKQVLDDPEWGYSTDNLPSMLSDSWLYIGDGSHARNLVVLRQLSITHVVNVAGEIINIFPEEIIYFDQADGVRDNSDSDLTSYFDLVNEFINQAHAAGGRILLHCSAGISRSATIAIAYFIAMNNWTAVASFAFCQKKRPQIAPNVGFQKQLLSYAERHQAKQVPEGIKFM